MINGGNDLLIGFYKKRQGYNYEHCYAYDWNAMRGYHYLMRIGHLLNVLAAYSVKLIEAFKEKGQRALSSSYARPSPDYGWTAQRCNHAWSGPFN